MPKTMPVEDSNGMQNSAKPDRYGEGGSGSKRLGLVNNTRCAFNHIFYRIKREDHLHQSLRVF